MKEVTVEIADALADKLSKKAESQGVSPSQLVKQLIVESLEEKPQGDKAGGQARDRFVAMRLKGLDYPEIAADLTLPESTLREWDDELRDNEKAWRKAFVHTMNRTGSLNWEMKVKDRFYELWGSR